MSDKLREQVASQLTNRRLEINRTQVEMINISGLDRNTVLGIEQCRKVRFNGILKYAESLGASKITFEFDEYESRDEEVTAIVRNMWETLPNLQVAKMLKMSLPTLMQRMATKKWRVKEVEFILANFK